MPVFSSILLGLATADILFAIVQLYVLSSMRLIVNEMKPTTAWLMTVGPAVLVFVLAFLALNAPEIQMIIMWQIMGYSALVIFTIFQVAATKSIFDRRFEWDKENEKRQRVMKRTR